MTTETHEHAGSPRGGLWCWCLLTGLLLGCGADDEPALRAGQPLLSERDDRKEVYAHENAWMRSYAEQSTVALIDQAFFRTENGRSIFLNNGFPLGVARDLCPGERFAEQIAVASCSGTLIDDDLVLTSGHCVPDAAACASTRFLFNLHYTASGVLHSITGDDAFSCAEVVVRHVGELNNGDADFAIVRLDRPATPRFQPAPVRRDATALDLGQHLKIVGFPAGIPAKIDMEGNVNDEICFVPTVGLVTCASSPGATRTGFFLASLDVFAGNSGSGVYESDGYTLAGVNAGAVVYGDTEETNDYHPVTQPDGTTCNRATVCANSNCATAIVQGVRPALDALCAVPSRSARLCGTAAPVNDTCAAATVFSPVDGQQQTLSGFTTAATHEVTPSCGSRVASSPDVFYRFTLATPRLFYADAFSSDYPALLFLMSGTCGASSIVACGATACSTGQGRIALRLNAGTYVLGVSGSGNTRGRYNVHVQTVPTSQAAVPLVVPTSGNRLVSRTFTGITAGLPDGAAGTCGGVGSSDFTYYFITCPDYRGSAYTPFPVTATTCGIDPATNLPRATWNTVLHYREGYSPTRSCNDNGALALCGGGAQSYLSATSAPGSGLHALYVDGAGGAAGMFFAWLRVHGGF